MRTWRIPQMQKDPPRLPKVVIVGGGIGGVSAAQALQGIADVTVVDKRDYFEVPYANVRLPVEPTVSDFSMWPLFTTPKLGTVIQGEATAVTDKEVLLGKYGTLLYDYLILATGSRYADSFCSGAVTSLSARMHELEDSSQSLARAKTVLIIGGGPVGIELAGEISSAMPDKKVTLVHANDRLLPNFPPRAGEVILKTLQKQGVEVVLNDRAVKAYSGYELQRFDKQLPADAVGIRHREADVVFTCTGGKPNTRFLAANNVLDEGGFVKVDNHLRVEGHAKWFAIGDITNLPDGRFGRIAASQGKRAAAYIKALQGGGEPALQKMKPWRKDGGMSYIVFSLGREAGVMSIWGWSYGGIIPAYIKCRDLLVGMVRRQLGLK